MSKWAPMKQFDERYKRFLPLYEWRPLFGFGRWAFFVVRRLKP